MVYSKERKEKVGISETEWLISTELLCSVEPARSVLVIAGVSPIYHEPFPEIFCFPSSLIYLNMLVLSPLLCSFIPNCSLP